MLLSRADGDSSVSEETSAVALLENINTEHIVISIPNLLGSSFLKGPVSTGSLRRQPVPYHYNEHASWCQAGIVSCRDRRTAYTVTLFKLGSLSPWCSSQQSKSLVITYSSVKWAKKDLHIFKERQASGTKNNRGVEVEHGKCIHIMTSGRCHKESLVSRGTSSNGGSFLLFECLFVLVDWNPDQFKERRK